MSEHIKTGEEISHQFLFISQYKKGVFEKLLKEKWVSLSWLKEQVETKRIRINKSGDVRFRTTYGLSLEWFLSLLEEKP